jgi:hypothetical protein
MNDSTVRARLRRYFSSFPGWTVQLSIFAIFAAAAAIAILVFRSQIVKVVPETEPFLLMPVGVCIVALCVLLVGLCVLRVLFDFFFNPSDRQVDKWLHADLEEMIKRGMEKLNLEESDLVSEHYVTVGGPLRPDFGGEFRNARLKSKEGRDGYFRYSIYEFLIIYFTKDHLSVYKCIWHFEEGKVLLDETHEFFYRSVVSVSTVQVQGKVTDKNRSGGSRFQDYTEFRLVTTAGTSVGTNIQSEQFVRDGDPWISEAEKTTKAVRKMLREKNMGS